MKKKRILAVYFLVIFLVLIVLFSSMIFKVSSVELRFYDRKNNIVLAQDTKHFASKTQLDEIVKSSGINFDSLIFLADKKTYTKKIEQKNSYIKVLNIESVFPNKLRLNLFERMPLFCFYDEQEKKFFVIDSDFKILDVLENKNDLIELQFQNDKNENLSYSTFFGISSTALSKGDFLTNSNKVFETIKNMENIFLSKTNMSLQDFLLSAKICEVSQGVLTLKLFSSTSSFGLELDIENVLKKFDKKFSKIVDAFLTLTKTDNIKTTYGRLVINDDGNCFWYKL